MRRDNQLRQAVCGSHQLTFVRVALGRRPLVRQIPSLPVRSADPISKPRDFFTSIAQRALW